MRAWGVSRRGEPLCPDSQPSVPLALSGIDRLATAAALARAPARRVCRRPPQHERGDRAANGEARARRRGVQGHVAGHEGHTPKAWAGSGHRDRAGRRSRKAASCGVRGWAGPQPTAQHGTALHGTAQHCTAQHGWGGFDLRGCWVRLGRHTMGWIGDGALRYTTTALRARRSCGCSLWACPSSTQSSALGWCSTWSSRRHVLCCALLPFIMPTGA